MSINVCVLGQGRNEFCRSIAKPSQPEDFTMFNTNYHGRLINLVEPTRYPEKISALVNSVFLSDFTVFFAGEANAELGEQIVLLDLMGAKGCFVSDLDLAPFTKGTSLERWPIIDSESARKLVLEELQPPKRDGDAIVFVDHSFEVKGVGSVLLGVVHRGKVKVHDSLISFPGGKELEVKSIQKNDVDVAEAEASDRLGIGMKKLKSDDVPRGSVLSNRPLKIVGELENKIEFSKFSAKDSTSLHAFHCLQSVPCKAEGGKIILEKELALVPGLLIVFCDLNKKMRVIGKMKAE